MLANDNLLIYIDYNDDTFCVFLQGTAQLSLAECEGSAEMVYHWLRVQMLSGVDLPRPEHKSLGLRRHHDSQEDEQRPRAMVNTHTCVCSVNNSRVE